MAGLDQQFASDLTSSKTAVKPEAVVRAKAPAAFLFTGG
jgi:hypothetical protein